MTRMRTAALACLAGLFLGTQSGQADPPRDVRAQFAEAMALHASAPQDGIAALLALAQAGYGRALDRLAYFHLTGQSVPRDPHAARALYAEAVAAGHSRSLVSLAKVEMTLGAFAEAQTTLDLARAAGDARAEPTLAWAHATGRLGPRSDPAAGLARLRSLAAENNREAQLLLPAALISNPAAPGLSAPLRDRLEDRAAQGDARAAEALLRYLRLRADPTGTPEARVALLETPGLRPKIRIEEALHLAAVQQAHRFWRAAEEIVATAPPAVLPRALVVTARLNRNAYLRLLQKELDALGYDTGAPSPYLRAPLIRAINRFCRDRDIALACKPGPLKSTTIKALAAELGTARAETTPAVRPQDHQERGDGRPGRT